MDELKKLLQKISKKDRERLLKIMERLISGDIVGIDIQKLKSKKVFRARIGRFRIIFCITGKSIEILTIKVRNEKTYK